MRERGAVAEDTFYANHFLCKRKRLSVHGGKTDKILAAHVERICEAHDTVLRSCYQPIYGSSEADTTLMENLQEQVYV